MNKYLLPIAQLVAIVLLNGQVFSRVPYGTALGLSLLALTTLLPLPSWARLSPLPFALFSFLIVGLEVGSGEFDFTSWQDISFAGYGLVMAGLLWLSGRQRQLVWLSLPVFALVYAVCTLSMLNRPADRTLLSYVETQLKPGQVMLISNSYDPICQYALHDYRQQYGGQPDQMARLTTRVLLTTEETCGPAFMGSPLVVPSDVSKDLPTPLFVFKDEQGHVNTYCGYPPGLGWAFYPLTTRLFL